MAITAFWMALAAARTLPPGKARAVVASRCIVCHSLDVVTAAAASKARWQAVVDEMVTDGAQLSPAEVPVVVDYLARSFPARPATATRPPAGPAGPAQK